MRPRPDRRVVLVGPLAQLVEQRTLNPLVVGSIPTRPTNSFMSVPADRQFIPETYKVTLSPGTRFSAGSRRHASSSKNPKSYGMGSRGRVQFTRGGNVSCSTERLVDNAY